MARQISIKVEGLDKLKRIAEREPAVAIKHINKAIVNSMATVEDKIIPIIPQKTRTLIGQLRIPHFKPLYGSIGSDLEYAARVHDLYSAGTPYRHPSKNPRAVAGFLTVGVRQAQEKINEFFRDALNNITEELVR